MAAHRKLDRRRGDLCVAGFRKRVVSYASERGAVRCIAWLGDQSSMARRSGFDRTYSTRSLPPQSAGLESKIVSESVHECPHGSRNEHWRSPYT